MVPLVQGPDHPLQAPHHLVQRVAEVANLVVRAHLDAVGELAGANPVRAEDERADRSQDPERDHRRDGHRDARGDEAAVRHLEARGAGRSVDDRHRHRRAGDTQHLPVPEDGLRDEQPEDTRTARTETPSLAPDPSAATTSGALAWFASFERSTASESATTVPSGARMERFVCTEAASCFTTPSRLVSPGSMGPKSALAVIWPSMMTS